MNKCLALNGFTRCVNDGVWTLSVGAESIDTCASHLQQAFMYLLQSCGNAVERDVTVTVHWSPT